MTFPTVIHSQVDPAAVTKVTRLFNNTIEDVLAELIQNARRANASTVKLTVTAADGIAQLSIADDGSGIADPSVVLALGRSGWNDSIARREDPAGMGVFSLAGRHALIRSCPNTTGEGWQFEIAPEAWEDGRAIAVDPCARPRGTEIVVALDTSWANALDRAARNAARHCPIRVHLNGERLEPQDWLAGAKAVFEENGVRIGVFDDHRANRDSASINFHGVTVPGALPSIAESDVSWCVRVDIVDAPELQLVLPARKEMIENDALRQLRRNATRAIYRHIQKRASHRLPFEHWAEAEKLGVYLPEARPELIEWAPATADPHNGITRSKLTSIDELLIVESFAPPIEQCAHFALDRDARFAGRLASLDPKMEGYSWYDRLSRITGMAFEIERAGETFRYDETNLPGVEGGLVDRLDLVITVAGTTPETVTIPAPVMIEYDEGSFWTVDDANVVLTSREAITPAELVDLLEGACFSSSDDRDADSWDTQRDRFLLDAREIATRILMGDDAAILERLRAVLAHRVQWFVPEGRKLYASIGRDTLELDIDPSEPIDAVQL
ncbi:ATP-binding protein [Sphingomonas panacis]|uniref:ATP-binding protein n=1 Tax=Sphingomonas panacis TaxID=1560345 RepID=UPI000AFD63DA|nr:ATP-binding protein [Sphingomonas panacis]